MQDARHEIQTESAHDETIQQDESLLSQLWRTVLEELRDAVRPSQRLLFSTKTPLSVFILVEFEIRDKLVIRRTYTHTHNIHVHIRTYYTQHIRVHIHTSYIYQHISRYGRSWYVRVISLKKKIQLFCVFSFQHWILGPKNILQEEVHFNTES